MKRSFVRWMADRAECKQRFAVIDPVFRPRESRSTMPWTGTISLCYGRWPDWNLSENLPRYALTEFCLSACLPLSLVEKKLRCVSHLTLGLVMRLRKQLSRKRRNKIDIKLYFIIIYGLAGMLHMKFDMLQSMHRYVIYLFIYLYRYQARICAFVTSSSGCATLPAAPRVCPACPRPNV